MTYIIRQVENETLLAEVETLVVIAGESAKKATHWVAKQPTSATKTISNARKDVPSANERTEDKPQAMLNNCGNLESEHNTEAVPAYSMIWQDRPIFIPIDRNWYYLGAQNAPSVRQTEIIQRPP